MRLVDLAGIQDRVLDALLSGVQSSGHTYDNDWKLAILGEYAARGNQEAFRIVQEHAWNGNDWAQIALAHSGQVGLEWLTENVLPDASRTRDSSLDLWLPHPESLDESPAQRRLRAIFAETDEERNKVEDALEGLFLTPRQYLDRLRDGNLPQRARSNFRNAATDEYRELLELWMADPFGPAQGYAGSTLPCRPFPLPFGRLFSFAKTPQEKHMLSRFLREMPHPEVRDHSLQRLRERPIPFDALEPLRSSFQDGDEAAIAGVLPQIESQDRTSRFGFIFHLLYLMEDYEDVEWQPFAEWIYEQGEDSSQRRKAVEWMAELGAIPATIQMEGIDDAESIVRRICLASNPGST